MRNGPPQPMMTRTWEHPSCAFDFHGAILGPHDYFSARWSDSGRGPGHHRDEATVVESVWEHAEQKARVGAAG